MEQRPIDAGKPPVPPESLTVDVRERGPAGKVHKITVRQLTIGEYKGAMKFVDDEDECALVALVTDQPLNAISDLDAPSYEALLAAHVKVNAYFFSYAARAAVMRNIMKHGLGAFSLPGQQPAAD